MQQKRDNTRRNLIASLKDKFQQDEAMARGHYAKIIDSKTPKHCAPHNYRSKQDSGGEYWQCNCGHILDHQS